MHTAVNEHNKQEEREGRPDRNCGLWSPLCRIEWISQFEQSIRDRDFEAGVAPAADHREQPFVHALHRLILGLHG
jgi:hypothetical protein